MRVKTVKKNREYKRGRSALYDKKRKLHSVYYNAEEWDKITPYGEEFPKPWPCQNFLVPLQAI